MESKAIEPALGILEGTRDVFPGEAFVMRCVAVCCESGVDEGTLLFCQEVCSVRVVVNEKVSSKSDDNRHESFL